MEEENKVQEPKKEENQGKEIKLTAQVIIVCMAILAMALFVVCKVCQHFGVQNDVFYGVMSIMIYGLSLAGIIWAYARTKKTSFELWLNVAVFGLAIGLLGL